jgi:uncharacterized membrane protein YphA (DoxX/SURF4 family)
MTESNQSTALRAGLWIAQLLVGIPFVMIGFMKFSTPIPVLAKTIPWAGQLPELFVRSIGLVDIAGGLGIVLPALTRIKPRLTVWAAGGCVALQVCAIIFHISRGEAAFTPLNFVFLALAAFVCWGRLPPARVYRSTAQT